MEYRLIFLYSQVHYFKYKFKFSCFIVRACGATIVNRTEEIKEEDIGTSCGLFEIKKIGDE